MNLSKITKEAPQGAVYWSPVVEQYFCRDFRSFANRNVVVEKSERHELIKIVNSEIKDMALLTHFSKDNVLKFAYGDKDRAIRQMKRSINFYWQKRNNHPIAKSRLKSAISIIRSLSK